MLGHAFVPGIHVLNHLDTVRRGWPGQVRPSPVMTMERLDDEIPSTVKFAKDGIISAVRVYYEDTDFSGIVYHASYLRFMERGRTNYLRLIGADHRALFEQAEKEAPGFSFVVRHMGIDFKKPAYMDDVLSIVTTPEEVKGASVTLNQKVMRGEELLVEAHVQVAFISGGRARPIRSRCAWP